MSHMEFVMQELLFTTGGGILMGKDPCIWRVLTIDPKEHKALLIAEEPVTMRLYTAHCSKGVTYGESEIRHYLEEDFYPQFFTEKEKEAILETEILTSDYSDPYWDEITRDHVFLLSAQEYNAYLPYTELKGRKEEWWLRDHRQVHDRAIFVQHFPLIYEKGESVFVPKSIRPALWLDLDSEFFLSLVTKQEGEQLWYRGPACAYQDHRLCFTGANAEHLHLPYEINEISENIISDCPYLTDICWENPALLFASGSIARCPKLKLPPEFFADGQHSSQSFYPFFPDNAAVVHLALGSYEKHFSWSYLPYGAESALFCVLSFPSMEELARLWRGDKEELWLDLAFIPYHQDARKLRSAVIEESYLTDGLHRYPDADLAAAKVPHSRLLEKLGDISTLDNHTWLALWPVFANEEDIETGAKQFVKELDFYTSRMRTDQEDKTRQLFLQEMLYNNFTIAALRFLDDAGLLEDRAVLEQCEAADLRKKYLSQLELDDQGFYTMQIGNQVWKMKPDPRMNLRFYPDDPSGRSYAALPQNMFEAGQYKEALTAIKKYQYRLKITVDALKSVFQREFYSGHQRTAEQWRKMFMEQPLGRLLAQRLIFVQNGQAFTMQEDGTLTDVYKNEYQLTNEPIAFAHPMETDPGTTRLWRQYFAKGSVKGLWRQMNEPVYDPAEILPDHFAGYEFPRNMFQNRQPEGIILNERTLRVKGCRIKADTYNNMIRISNFEFDHYSRQVNHIVNILEKHCAAARIKKDDPRISGLLKNSGREELNQFLRTAHNNNCRIVTPLIIEQLHQLTSEEETFKDLEL